MKEELKKRFDEFKSETSVPELDWQNIGPKIQKGIAEKKKKKRRGAFWLFFGAGFFLLAFIIIALNWNFTPSNDQLTGSTQNLERQNTPDTATSNRKIEEGQLLENLNAKNEQTIEKNTSTLSWPIQENQPALGAQLDLTKRDAKLKKRGILNLYPFENIGEKARESRNTKKGLSTDADFKPHQEKLNNKIALIPLLSNKLPEQLSATTGSFDLAKEKLGVKVDTKGFDQNSLVASPFSNWTLDFNIGLNIVSVAEDFNSSSDRPGNHISSHIEYGPSTGFVIGIGFNYDNVRFQSTTQQMDSTFLYRPNTIDTIFRYSDDFEFYTYKDSINGINVTDFGHTNQVKNFSIPIFIGYDWKVNRLQVGVRAGLSFQFRQQLVGRLLNKELQIVNVNETYTNSNIHHYLRLQIGYQFSNRWSVWTHLRQNGMSSFENPVNSNEIGSRALFSGSIGLKVRL